MLRDGNDSVQEMICTLKYTFTFILLGLASKNEYLYHISLLSLYVNKSTLYSSPFTAVDTDRDFTDIMVWEWV